ncbi:hypothetical protein EDD66_103202 [Mobilisporobacter senegalensis]|uniref:Ribosomal processing cysteine protease Prp n=1 Tax=Mobilisporobacter senegalensis TaxID=1329262 RepID=A0A3N1XRK1_9FIRM|nr:ribosomal-processing cysteine protease Prp [Mobilisporobacter senegalensis]ROR29266.1 hypothetical protein EDD66_103202 [Mobilisporobacter senegalensis]
MINISIYKNADGVYTGFKSSGHAGFANKGQDIVCAAVSVLVINTINSIETFTSDKFDLIMDEESGLIEFNVLTRISNESILLLKSLVLGLQGIAEDYGHDYIKLTL